MGLWYLLPIVVIMIINQNLSQEWREQISLHGICREIWRILKGAYEFITLGLPEFQ